MKAPAEEVAVSDTILLRRWRADDVAAVRRAVAESIDHLRPWTSWVADGYPVEAAREFIDTTRRRWDERVTFDYAITISGEIVGGCGLMTRLGPGAFEIGYWVHRARTGEGIITKTVERLAEVAFGIGAERVVIIHDELNERSGAVPARLGFRLLERRASERERGAAESGTELVWELRAP
ncbi:GNAT family N-acetyltransferase [Amycolatopsis minnesotensis]|uniref:GNAT family N-acetyltransferase n=1 Tax=Amycolatopsis minnesotensis TaxID=337894 RepID=A0ABN2RW19_9PSEU